jgi:hypothetical protein
LFSNNNFIAVVVPTNILCAIMTQSLTPVESKCLLLSSSPLMGEERGEGESYLSTGVPPYDWTVELVYSRQGVKTDVVVDFAVKVFGKVF